MNRPKVNAVWFDNEFTVYNVQAVGSPWGIAKKVYKDEDAWVVGFGDNEKMLTSHGGLRHPGMELKIPTALWPDYKK